MLVIFLQENIEMLFPWTMPCVTVVTSHAWPIEQYTLLYIQGSQLLSSPLTYVWINQEILNGFSKFKQHFIEWSIVHIRCENCWNPFTRSHVMDIWTEFDRVLKVAVNVLSNGTMWFSSNYCFEKTSKIFSHKIEHFVTCLELIYD